VKGDLRKKQIIDTGKKLFALNGYYGTHVDSILREAKIGKGTFYLYFKNKEDLFITILEDFLNAWEDDLVKIMEEEDPLDLKKFYQAVLKRSFSYFMKDLPISNILLRVGPGTSDIFEPFIERFENRVHRLIMDYLKRGIDAGLFREDLDVELIGNVLAGGHMRIFYYYIIKKKGNRQRSNLDYMSEKIYDLIISGMMA
jgi:TetR/AcrR family fatty acid metabolism transcriptional regulator